MKVIIYSIQNKINGKCYIGATKRKHSRWKDHERMLLQNRHHAFKLQKAYNKYGKENLVFKVIEECEYKDALEKEQFYLNKYDSFHNGYNSNAFSNQTTPDIQSKRTKKRWEDPEQRKRQSLLATGLWTKEHKEKHALKTSEGQKRRWTKEAREAQSLKMKGNKYNEQRKTK